MKKLVLFLTLVVLGVCGYAQTVNIYRTNGEIVRTSSDSVSHISFVEKMDTIKIIGVDFGLPSGLLWANMNVGADNPEECGLYFAWGDTQGHRKEENFPFTWENYKWYDSESGNLTKYCVSDTLDVVDNKNTLDLEDDPANAAWGDGWRMPTAAEVKELLEYASVFYMVNGFEIRHKLTPENVKIFCPFTGSFEGTKLKSGNISAKLWCSSLGEGGTKGADDFSYLKKSIANVFQTNRCDGLCVRPVRQKKENDDATTCVYVKRRYYYIHKMCGDVQMYKEDDVSYINFSDYHPVETEGHEAIDLGLPSGLLWATTNIGAEVPEDYGFYFQWGDSEVKTQDNVHETSWTKYKWCDAAPDKLTKYCLSEDYGTVDNKSLLDMEDDAAHVLWNGEWRMPAIEDMQELIDNTTKEWTTINGVTGMKFTSKTIGTSIFLPAAGYGDGAYFGGEGYYWTSSLLYSNDDASSSIANCLYAPVSENVCFLTAYYRSAGLPIRPVHPK